MSLDARDTRLRFPFPWSDLTACLEALAHMHILMFLSLSLSATLVFRNH
jgi:hypothetical protein